MTITLQIDLFKLTDPLKSFAYDNRTILRVVNFGPIDSDEVYMYYQTSDVVEAMFPLAWWDYDKTYYDMKYDNITQYSSYFDSGDNFTGFLNPEPIFATAPSKPQSDPDSAFIPWADPVVYLNFARRHAAEAASPFVYGAYSLKPAPGCHHQVSNASVICFVCNQCSPCPRCHDDKVFSHSFELGSVVCACSHAQPYAKNCSQCALPLTNCFCETCRTVTIIDEQTEAFHHCPLCSSCHRWPLRHSIRCDLCGKCYTTKHGCAHVCGNDQYCIVCQGDLGEDDVIKLQCSEMHAIHAECLYKFIRTGGDSCPVCRRSFLSQVEKLLYKSALMTEMRKKTFGTALAVFMCRDCKKIYVDNGQCVCRECWSYNCDLLGYITKKYRHLYTEYIYDFYTVRKDLKGLYRNRIFGKTRCLKFSIVVFLLLELLQYIFFWKQRT